MGDAIRIITLGIGPGSDIAGLVLVGLNAQVVVIPTVKGSAVIGDSSIYAIALANSLVSDTALTDAPVGALSLADALFGSITTVETSLGWHEISLEDGSGFWLFEDGNVMIWFDGVTGVAIGDS